MKSLTWRVLTCRVENGVVGSQSRRGGLEIWQYHNQLCHGGKHWIQKSEFLSDTRHSHEKPKRTKHTMNTTFLGNTKHLHAHFFLSHTVNPVPCSESQSDEF